MFQSAQLEYKVVVELYQTYFLASLPSSEENEVTSL